jgi:hypothetical protein
MATRNIVPRADGEGGLGKPAKKWGDVYVDRINGASTSATPTATAIPVSGADGKLATSWLPSSVTPAPDTMPIAGPSGKLASGWLPPSAGGSGASMLTLFHTMQVMETDEAEGYEDLYEGAFIARSAWRSAVMELLVERDVTAGGTGRVRVTLSDGTSTVTEEGPAYTVGAVDVFTLDGAALSDGAVWTLTVSARTYGAGTARITRVKLLAPPADSLAPLPVALGVGGTVSGSTWGELGSGTMLGGEGADGGCMVLLSGSAVLSGTGGATVRCSVWAGSEKNETCTEIVASGVFLLGVSYPDAPGSVSFRIEGRTEAGTTLELPVWQLDIAN